MDKRRRPILVFVPLKGVPVIIRPPALSTWELDISNDLSPRLFSSTMVYEPVVLGSTVAYRADTPPTSYGAGCRWEATRERRPSGREVMRFTEQPEGPMSAEAAARRLSQKARPRKPGEYP